MGWLGGTNAQRAGSQTLQARLEVGEPVTGADLRDICEVGGGQRLVPIAIA